MTGKEATSPTVERAAADHHMLKHVCSVYSALIVLHATTIEQQDGSILSLEPDGQRITALESQGKALTLEERSYVLNMAGVFIRRLNQETTNLVAQIFKN